MGRGRGGGINPFYFFWGSGGLCRYRAQNALWHRLWHIFVDTCAKMCQIAFVRCKICSSPLVKEIDTDLQSSSIRAVSEKWKLNRTTLSKHFDKCLKKKPITTTVPECATVLAKPVERVKVPRLHKGRVLESVVGYIELLNDALSAAISMPEGVSLRERHLVLRTTVQVMREARGWMEVAVRMGLAEASESDLPDDPTVEDLRVYLGRLHAELEAAEGWEDADA